MSVFVTQGFLDIILETGVDISSASDLKILYIDPTGTSGEWAGTLEGTTKIKRALTDSDITISGEYKLQSHFVIGGRTGLGDVVTQTFKVKIPES